MEVQEIKEQLKNMFRTVLNSNPNVKEYEDITTTISNAIAELITEKF